MLAIIGSTICALLLISCGSRQEERISVNGTNFCVPRVNLIKESFYNWVLTKDIEKKGFRFILKLVVTNAHDGILGLNGKHLIEPITGYVESETRFRNWMKPQRGSPIWEKLEDRRKREFVVHDRYVASKGAGNYLIWSPGNMPVTLESQITDKARLVAICDDLDDKGQPIHICNRVILFERVAIFYNFDYSLLENINFLDKKVSSVIDSWKCTDIHKGNEPYQ